MLAITPLPEMLLKFVPSIGGGGYLSAPSAWSESDSLSKESSKLSSDIAISVATAGQHCKLTAAAS